jgi:Fe-S oxidoreductase
MSYNPNDAQYFDVDALEGELRRSFDLCHSCRLCFKYCQSFPTLFRAVDENDGDARSLDDSVSRQVVDECFQCKLCYVNCPYTPTEEHEFQLDFPALLQRSKAQRVLREGVSRRERWMADPDRVGRQGTQLPVLSNAVNRNRTMRVLMEKTLGIHRDKQLPEFHRPTYEQWFEAETEGRGETSQGQHPVVLFHTCFVNYNNPQIGRDAVEVLSRNDCRVACSKSNCCGMPALESGDVAQAQQMARKNVNALLPWVERGYAIAVVNPTCSLMLKREYPLLLDDPADPAMRDATARVSEATRDLCEYLFQQRQNGHYDEQYQSTPRGTIAYHVPCHLKAQNIGFRARDLMRKIPGVKIRLVNACSGHDGTWAMKREYFELSMKNGSEAFQQMQDAEAEVWASDCPLAALQFEQATGRRPMHPIQVLARSYRRDGFAHPVDTEAPSS